MKTTFQWASHQVPERLPKGNFAIAMDDLTTKGTLIIFRWQMWWRNTNARRPIWLQLTGKVHLTRAITSQSAVILEVVFWCSKQGWHRPRARSPLVYYVRIHSDGSLDSRCGSLSAVRKLLDVPPKVFSFLVEMSWNEAIKNWQLA